MCDDAALVEHVGEFLHCIASIIKIIGLGDQCNKERGSKLFTFNYPIPIYTRCVKVLIPDLQVYQYPITAFNHLHLEHWYAQDDEDQIDILLCESSKLLNVSNPWSSRLSRNILDLKMVGALKCNHWLEHITFDTMRCINLDVDDNIFAMIMHVLRWIFSSRESCIHG